MTTGVDPVRTFVENFSVESYTALQGAQLDALLLAKARELFEWGAGRNAGRVPRLTEYGWRRGTGGGGRPPRLRDGYFLALDELRGRIFRVISVKLIRQWATPSSISQQRGASPLSEGFRLARMADPMLHPLSGEVVQALDAGRKITEIRKTVGLRNIEATKIKAAWEMGALPAPVVVPMSRGQTAPSEANAESLKGSLRRYARLRPDLDANQLRVLTESSNQHYTKGQREWLRGASNDAIHSRVGRPLRSDPDTAMKWNRKRRLGQDKGVTVYVAEALVGEFAA